MQEIFIAPFLLGLSTGIYCLTFCIPFIVPVMVAEQRAKKGNLFLLLKFISGRLVGYLAFGALFGYLGEKINTRGVSIVLNSALILLSISLILHALGIMGEKRFVLCGFAKKHTSKIPFLMGFFMGVNVCPPFLMSLAYVFTLHSALKGIIYFLMFFLGTTLYFLPIFFLGYLNPIKEFQWVGKVSALIVGLLFLGYGVYQVSGIL